VEPPSTWPWVVALLGLSAVGGGFLVAGLWPVAIVIGVVGIAVFIYASSRQVGRLEAEFAAAGVEPDYSAADARDFKRIGLTATAVLMLLTVALVVWAVIIATR
jgi:hypothetical protein